MALRNKKSFYKDVLTLYQEKKKKNDEKSGEKFSQKSGWIALSGTRLREKKKERKEKNSELPLNCQELQQFS